MATVNKFRDKILTVLGEIEFSNTQKIRILRVRDEMTEEVRIHIGKWWRPLDTDGWQAGKGFKVSREQAKELAKILSRS